MEEKLRLMIVDDNPHARNALSAFISTQDWVSVISEAVNGEDALEKIEESIPDVILMDMRMPVMGGLEATGIIKQSWPQVKVIVLTIYSEDQSDALSAGADAFLVKGCATETIMSSINRLLHPG